jgi:hypothetical protein
MSGNCSVKIIVTLASTLQLQAIAPFKKDLQKARQNLRSHI